MRPAEFVIPPEPFRYVGGSLIRRALMWKDAGRKPDPLTAFVATLPRRLRLNLPR